LLLVLPFVADDLLAEAPAAAGGSVCVELRLVTDGLGDAPIDADAGSRVDAAASECDQARGRR